MSTATTPPPSPPNAPAAPPPAPAARTFRYEAQSDNGERLDGTIDAPDAETALMRLQALRLRVTEIEPLAREKAGGYKTGRLPLGGKPLKGDDFIAFNQQLAHLTAAGMPIESGLRLIARDVRKGRLAKTIGAVADELDKGTPLGEAFTRHGARFPSLYGRLLDAGVRSGDLPAVLLNLGRHQQLVQRLRGALWRTFSYPLVALATLSLVLVFLGIYVLPQFEAMFAGFQAPVMRKAGSFRSFGPAGPPGIPLATQALFAVTHALPWLGGLLLMLLVLCPLVWGGLRVAGRDRHVIDGVLLRLPLVGRALALSLIARWCDTLRVGVAAGMPLPAAIGLASDAVPSPRLRRDGQLLIERLEAGQPLGDDGGSDDEEGKPAALDLLPATVPAALDLAAGRHDLPTTLNTLAELYERQAESRVQAIPAILTPILVIVVAVTVGFVLLGLLQPLARMIDSLM